MIIIATAKGSAVVFFLRLLAKHFPGINAYVMEVLAQRVALFLLSLINIDIIYSDCQSAINSVRAVTHTHLKQALGAAPAGILLAGFPPAPNCHIEWTRAHPERREKNNTKWSYRDCGIYLADAAASNNHAPFNEIYGLHQMTNRFLSLDLRDIIFELLAPDQCYWEWKESGKRE